MYDQEIIRERLNQYISKNGIKAKYIAKQINVPDYMICRFRSNKINLNESSIESLDEYLHNKE